MSASESSVSRPPLSVSDKIARAKEFKEAGTEAFKAGEVQKAIGKYVKVFGFTSGLKPMKTPGMESMLTQSRPPQFQVTEEEIRALDDLELTTYLNLCACYIKLQDGKQTIKYGNKALEIDPNNVKGLARRGNGYLLIGDADSAVQDLERAIKLSPSDKGIQDALTRARTQNKQQEAAMRARMSKMFVSKDKDTMSD